MEIQIYTKIYTNIYIYSEMQQMQGLIGAFKEMKIDSEMFLCIMLNKFIEFSILTKFHMGH